MLPSGAGLRDLLQASRFGLRRLLRETLLTKPRRLGGVDQQLLLTIGGDLRGKLIGRVPALLQDLGARRSRRLPVKHGYALARLGVRDSDSSG